MKVRAIGPDGSLLLETELKTFPAAIGRAAPAALIIPNHMVSTRHAVLLKTGNSYEIQDTGSTNGTFLDGQKIERHSFSPPCRIQIGAEVTLEFEAAEQALIEAPVEHAESTVAGPAPAAALLVLPGDKIWDRLQDAHPGHVAAAAGGLLLFYTLLKALLYGFDAGSVFIETCFLLVGTPLGALLMAAPLGLPRLLLREPYILKPYFILLLAGTILGYFLNELSSPLHLHPAWGLVALFFSALLMWVVGATVWYSLLRACTPRSWSRKLTLTIVLASMSMLGLVSAALKENDDPGLSLFTSENWVILRAVAGEAVSPSALTRELMSIKDELSRADAESP